jgi:hypothetical protein
MKSFNDFVLKAATTKRPTTAHECNISLEIEGENFRAYEVNIAPGELMFLTDSAVICYDVNTFGDRHSALLFSIERE